MVPDRVPQPQILVDVQVETLCGDHAGNPQIVLEVGADIFLLEFTATMAM